jgi:hypothetical protein
MAELKIGFRAVFYSGSKVLSVAPVKETYEKAAADIEKDNEVHSVFKYNPWTHAQVEKVYYRH